MLRSCYRSIWNIPGHGAVAGHFFWAREDAPFFPYPTYFTSGNWQRGDGQDWPEFGEQAAAPRPWESGGFPYPDPLPLFFGQGSCVGSGVDGLREPVPAGLLWGVDARCWVVVPPAPHAGPLTIGGTSREPRQFFWAPLDLGGTAREPDQVPAGALDLGGTAREPDQVPAGALDLGGVAAGLPAETAAGGLDLGGVAADGTPADLPAGALDLGGTSVEPWTPRALPGLTVWWKSDDRCDYLFGVPCVDGDLVAQWRDISGNLRHAGNGGISFASPVFHTGRINGLPAVTFDGSDDLLLFTMVPLPAWTLFIVYKQLDQTNYNGPLGWCATGVAGFATVTVTDDNSQPHQMAVMVYDGSAETGNVARQGTETLPTGWRAATWQSTPALYVNGSAETLVGNASGWPFTLNGLGRSWFSGYFSGEIAEVIVCDSVLGGGDLAELNAYRLDRYGF